MTKCGDIISGGQQHQFGAEVQHFDDFFCHHHRRMMLDISSEMTLVERKYFES
jgi:hypothetical protein